MIKQNIAMTMNGRASHLLADPRHQDPPPVQKYGVAYTFSAVKTN